MNKQYFDDLINKHENGEKMTELQYSIWYEYKTASKRGVDWIGIHSMTGVDAAELVDIMKNADIQEIYLTREWSNQFPKWYELQEAGLTIGGIRQVINPMYEYEIKKYGSTSQKPKQFVLVFKLNN